jgi:hypothetical protein
MKVGGAVSKLSKGGFAPAQKGGDNTRMGIYGIPNAGGTGPETMKTGGMVSRAVQASCKNGTVRGADGRCVNSRPIQFATGGMVKNAKLAALAAPKNKITRADIIVGAKKRAAKKR